jgi:NAD(P)-dependent dehydrogenase (short-subunit alcohol dehydrogenase family)
VFQVNVVGAVNTVYAFLDPMRARQRGTFLFLSSVAGQIGSQTDPPYSASKAALINFALCAAKDLAPYNIRVNSLCPGMVDTPLNRSIWAAHVRNLPAGQQPTFEEWAEEKIKRVIPLNRWQTPEDIANMAVFLASPRAQNVTGQTVNVDGGFVMNW